jgi:putative OPT family oligopeptide transporter
LLGIVFGASSMYLVLRVGLTVSASIPVAVLSITLFRAFSRLPFIRRATILENNIVQTTGSAGESIAFGIGVTMPALMLLGFEMDVVRVMTVGVLGGLLGILMMIPLRRAFIVKQHGSLKYPEGTACAEVLVAGEKGGATARMVFLGFGIAFLHRFLAKACKLWKEEPSKNLFTESGKGLKGGVLGGEFSPELLGVGYIIGPRIASIMVAGGVLAYLVLAPTIVMFGENVDHPIAPAQSKIDPESGNDVGLIKNMDIDQIRNNYILYIGAGAVATGGVISMLQALPLIFGAFRSGLRDMMAKKSNGESRESSAVRTERDLPMWVVLAGSAGLVLALAAAPKLGLGLSPRGLVAAGLIVVFGFLFVTVSSRLTGEIGSSSNPISGMTVATLLFTCLVFLVMGHTDKAATLAALTIAAVVCIASSNGGTTSQDLKTGFLVGATPKYQQISILVGAITSALVIGVTLLLMNEAGTVYTKKNIPVPARNLVLDVGTLGNDSKQHVKSGPYSETDKADYFVLNLGRGENAKLADGTFTDQIPQGKYLIDDAGKIAYLVDPGVNGSFKVNDDGTEIRNKFQAPKTRLMALIIDGILNQKLPWGLVLIGVLIALTLELTGVPSLPFAVGVYLPISASTPIFIGGVARWVTDKINRRSESEAETSPGVLLSSGYIAGGTLAAVLVAFFAFAGEKFNKRLDLGKDLAKEFTDANWPAVVAFGALLIVLLIVGADRLFAPGQKAQVASGSV